MKVANGMEWDADRYARDARFVAEYGEDVLASLAPAPGERILDMGCGDGALTAKIVACGAEVVGVDASPELVAAARRRGIDARLADAQALTFEAEFDAVFTNAALHWMPRTGDVLAGARRALRPGGRFVGEFGGHGNVAAIRTALAVALHARGVTVQGSPWYFPSAGRFAATLEACGFCAARATLFARATPLVTGMRAWLETFAGPFVAGFNARERSAIFEEVEALLAPTLRDEDGRWTGDYVRLRFEAMNANSNSATSAA